MDVLVFNNFFEKKQYFREKMRKTICGRTYRFEERGASGDKNQYKLFCWHWGFEYFLLNHFFQKKKTIFSKVTTKSYFWGHDHFWGKRALDSKNECYLFLGEIGYRIQFSSFFFKKPHTVRLKLEKLVFRGTFSFISMVLLGRLFPKTIEFTHEWSGTDQVNFMKISSKLWPVSCVHIHKYIYLYRSSVLYI